MAHPSQNYISARSQIFMLMHWCNSEDVVPLDFAFVFAESTSCSPYFNDMNADWSTCGNWHSCLVGLIAAGHSCNGLDVSHGGNTYTIFSLEDMSSVELCLTSCCSFLHCPNLYFTLSLKFYSHLSSVLNSQLSTFLFCFTYSFCLLLSPNDAFIVKAIHTGSKDCHPKNEE